MNLIIKKIIIFQYLKHLFQFKNTTNFKITKNKFIIWQIRKRKKLQIFQQKVGAFIICKMGNYYGDLILINKRK